MTTIPIERLASGNQIMIPGFGQAEVYTVTFDGEGYAVDYARSDAGWDDLDTHYVRCGGSVEYALIGAPRFMRAESDVSLEEWQAKGDAIGADIDLLQGREAQPVDHLMVAAVADAIGVPALEAAE